MEIFIGVPAGLVAATALGTWRSYHRLVTLDRTCESASSEIQAQLQARHALAPALVEAARAHAGRQRGIVNNLQVASAATIDAQEPGAVERAEAFFNASFARVASIVDNNPELRACPKIAQLRRDLATCNEKLAAARASFGRAVNDFNRALDHFPGKMIAGLLKMSARQNRKPGARIPEAAAA